MHQNDVNVLRIQAEREYATKVELEDKIMAKLQSKLTMNQEHNYLKKMANKFRIQKRQQVCILMFINIYNATLFNFSNFEFQKTKNSSNISS